MTVAEILKLLLLGSACMIVFALALRARADNALYMFTHPGVGLRALVAIFVVVPVVALTLAAAFDLSQPVEIAMVAIALSPLPPILPNKELKAGAGMNYVTGLLCGAAIASVVIAPLGLLFIDWMLPHKSLLHPMSVIPPVLIGTALPLVLGVIVHRLVGDERALKLAKPVAKVGNIVFGLIALVLIIALAPAMWQVIGNGTLIALTAMILAGVAASHWLGSSNPGEKSALMLAATARHPGVAIAIASANFPDAKLAPAAILLGTVLSMIIPIPFLKRIAAAGGGKNP